MMSMWVGVDSGEDWYLSLQAYTQIVMGKWWISVILGYILYSEG